MQYSGRMPLAICLTGWGVACLVAGYLEEEAVKTCALVTLPRCPEQACPVLDTTGCACMPVPSVVLLICSASSTEGSSALQTLTASPTSTTADCQSGKRSPPPTLPSGTGRCQRWVCFHMPFTLLLCHAADILWAVLIRLQMLVRSRSHLTDCKQRMCQPGCYDARPHPEHEGG